MIQNFCLLAIFLMSVPAWACKCAAWPSAKDAWLTTPVIFLGVVESADADHVAPHEPSMITLLVRADEVFKGAKRDQLFTLKQPGDSSTPLFKTGERVLFYLVPSKSPGTWVAAGCHRSRTYSKAMDDLLFLRKLPISARGNRLSGEVMLYENGPKNRFTKIRSLAGVKVTATLKNGPSLTTATNADGIYEWYGLSPGSYKVEIEVPKELTIAFPTITGIAQMDQNETIQLGPDSGASVNYILMANTKIKGRVLDSGGSPMEGVCVKIRSFPWNSQDDHFSPSDCTKSGKFEIKKFPPGVYYLVANSEGQQTARQPFPTLYFPGSADIKQAVPVTVPEGGTVEDLDFRVPSVRKSVELSGRVLFSDGVPVPKIPVIFRGPEELYREYSYTGSDGSFRIRILEGSAGELKAELMIDLSGVSDCAHFQAIRVERGWGASLESAPLFIDGESPMADIKLQIPAASCKGSSPRP